MARPRPVPPSLPGPGGGTLVAAPVEALEDPVPLRLRDAGTLVEDLQVQALGVGPAPGAHGDAAVRGAVLDRVVDQVGHDLVQPLGVRVGVSSGGDHVQVQMDVRTRVAAGSGGDARRAEATMLASFRTPDR